MSIEKIGIIGAGTMGAGIATYLASVGKQVWLCDASPEQAEKGKQAAISFYQKAVSKDKMTADEASAAAELITPIHDLADLDEVQLIIEAIFEEFAVKAELFDKLDQYIEDDVIIATNTSALTVSGLAETISCPERFLGLHYFNPASLNPIVEVVRGEKTDPGIYVRAYDFVKETGKKAIACKDAYGFAINRFFIPYANEAIRMVDEGLATPAQIDEIAKDCLGVAAGPFQVSNLVKPKIIFHAQQNLAPHGAYYALAKSLKDKGDKDYEFDLTASDDALDEATSTKIAQRIMASCFFPILQALDEQVASPADIDSGAVLALKFGKAPCQLMDQLGKDKVKKMVADLIAPYGHDLPKSIDNIGQLTTA